MSSPRPDRFALRLVHRTGSERMSNTRPEPYVLECGWERPGKAGKEKPGMVGIYLADLRDIADALEALAELWRRNERACRGEANVPGRIVVQVGMH